MDFNENPFIVIWEMTRSCGLRCVHCRAEALETRDPGELSLEEAFTLLSEIRRFGKPLVVLTGGDPMRRPDVFEVIEYGVSLGLHMALTPSGTSEMTREKVKLLKEKGLARLAVSLDGSDAVTHDRFRKVEGSFNWTLQILRWANELGLSTQINTTITKYNLEDLDALVGLLESLKISLWSVFFLVPVGRGKYEDEVSAQDYEKVFHKMADLSDRASFNIKSTEAPSYRRVLIQRNTSLPKNILGINDGKGFVFISHTGEIYPSGFLPLSAGNVKCQSLVSVYRDSPLFKRIRDTHELKGKCGACEFKSICGGSRSRAFAVTGDYMQSDPFCCYIPKRMENFGENDNG